SIQFSKVNSNDHMHGAIYGLYNIQSMQLKNPSGKKEPIYLKVLAWYERTRNWTNNTDEDNSYIIWSNSDNTKVPTDYPQLRG
ncbi:unnamed protein product, partial [Rotaria sp. Silwood2]